MQPFGSPADIVEDELLEARQVVDRLARSLMRAALEGVEAGGWRGGLHAVAREEVDAEPLAELLYRASLKGAMLGADDAEWEAEEEDVVTPERFERVLRLRRSDRRDEFRGRPFNDAVQRFRQRAPVTRDIFDELDAKQRSESFTVARVESVRAIETVQEEIARAMAEGNFGLGPSVSDLRAFRQRLRERMRDGGFLEEVGRLTPSHVETVFRNGVMGAYSDGRRAQMTQPAVLAARPYWQVMTVNDGPPRQRPTHRAVHGWVMLASDPGWQATAPPFGHNCRCRLVARSQRWVEKNGPHIHAGAFPALPDKGWTTRAAPPVPPTPLPGSPEAKPPTPEDKRDPPLTPRRPTRPLRPPPPAPKRPPSLLRDTDRLLPKRAKEALERLEGLERDKRGRIPVEALGAQRAQATHATELAEARANLDLDAMFTEERSTHVQERHLPMSRLVVDADHVAGDKAAELVRGGSAELPRVVEWGGNLHVLDPEALAAAPLDNKGHVRVKLSRFTTAQASIAKDLSPFRTREDARKGIAYSVAQGPRQVRAAVRRVLAGEGVVSRDLTIMRRKRDRIRVVGDLGQPGALAAHNIIDGEMLVVREVWSTATRAWSKLRGGRWKTLTLNEAQAASALVHEEIHGASHLALSARRGAGPAFEEATTELLSRRTMRRLVGVRAETLDRTSLQLPAAQGIQRAFWGKRFRHPWARPPTEGDEMAINPYDGPIIKLLRTCEDYGFTPTQVENAAEKLRGPKYRGKWASTERQAVDDFVRELPWGRAKVVRVRVGGEWESMAVSDAKIELGTDLLFALESALTLERRLSVAALERNDFDGAVEVFREAKRRGRLDLALAKALLLLQDDPRELFELILEEAGSLDPIAA